MPTLDAFDYSWSRPDPQQMAAAGIKVVMRYLYGPGKGIDRAELDGLLDAGIGVGLNYEAQRGNHLKGAAQGRIDGAAARGYAATLGPRAAAKPIYFSCDEQVSAAQLPTVMAYLQAADSAAHPSRAYGQFSVCERFGRPAWQTIAWSGGLVSKHAVLYQYAINQDFHGSDVDYNTILNLDELGACWPEGSEHDMALTDDDILRIKRAVISKDGETIAGELRQLDQLVTDLDALKVAVAKIGVAVAGLQSGGVDEDALAKRLAAHLTLGTK